MSADTSNGFRMSSAERRSVSHLRWSMSDRPDKTSKFLSGQTLLYTKHIRAVRGLNAQLNCYTKVEIEG